MPTTDLSRGVEALDADECLALLATARIGRVAYAYDALPAISPVLFRLHDGLVLAATHPGSDLLVAARDAVLAFGVDAYEPSGAGWSVTVVGPSRPVTEPAESAAFDTLDWEVPAPAARCYVVIRTTLVRGWRTGTVP